MSEGYLRLSNRRRILLLSGLLAVGGYWAGLIFFFGLMPYPPSLTSLSSSSESTLEHIATHVVLGALVYLFLAAWSGNAWRNAGLAFLFALGLGGSLELAQLLVPERNSEFFDFVSDALGAAAGVAIVALFARFVIGYERTMITAIALTFLVAVGVSVSASVAIAARPHTIDCETDAFALAANGKPDERGRALPEMGRQTDGLIALYDFSSGSGEIAYDISGVEPALDLRILDSELVSWLDGSNGVDLSGGKSVLRSETAARKIYDAVKATGQITVEVWAAPATLNVRAPVRIVSMSDGDTNFDLNYQIGQARGDLRERLRTLCSAFNQGRARNVFQSVGEVRQLVSTYDGITQRDYVDGSLYADRVIGGDLSNWDDGYPLLVGNETTLNQAFTGRVYLLAIYGRALSDAEVQRNFDVDHGPAGE